jgi:hypothetical protein
MGGHPSDVYDLQRDVYENIECLRGVLEVLVVFPDVFSGEGSHSKPRHRAFPGSTASNVLECTILIWRKSVKSSSPKITSSYQFSGFAGVCRRLRYFFLGFLVGNFRCVKAAICQNRVGVFISRRVLLASFANEK